MVRRKFNAPMTGCQSTKTMIILYILSAALSHFVSHLKAITQMKKNKVASRFSKSCSTAQLSKNTSQYLSRMYLM